jgi:hypothetical protein
MFFRWVVLGSWMVVGGAAPKDTMRFFLWRIICRQETHRSKELNFFITLGPCLGRTARENGEKRAHFGGHFRGCPGSRICASSLGAISQIRCLKMSTLENMGVRASDCKKRVNDESRTRAITRICLFSGTHFRALFGHFSSDRWHLSRTGRLGKTREK